MNIVYGEAFLKSAAKLPINQQRKLDALLDLCTDNPFDSRLHTKRLVGSLQGFLSQFVDADTIQMLRVAHRKDIYR